MCFRFFAGLPPGLAAKLRDLGVDAAEGLEPPRPVERARPRRLNVDTTTLVALVSNLSHGRVGFAFAEPAFEAQAAQEAAASVLAELAPTLAGATLCATPAVLATFRVPGLPGDEELVAERAPRAAARVPRARIGTRSPRR